MNLEERLRDPAIAPQRARLLELLRSLAFAEREVVLSSGLRSNFYIDCKRVSLDAEGQHLIGELFRVAIEAVAPEAQAIGGLTLGADPLASATSVMSVIAGRPLHSFIIRKEPKGHGTGRWLEAGGRIAPGAPVIIVEDVVTTGASALKAIERARESELRPVAVLGLVDRLEGGREAIEASRLPLYTLFTRKDFLP